MTSDAVAEKCACLNSEQRYQLNLSHLATDKAETRRADVERRLM